MITEIYNCAGASAPAGKRNEIARLEQTGELRKSGNMKEGSGKCFRNSSVSTS